MHTMIIAAAFAFLAVASKFNASLAAPMSRALFERTTNYAGVVTPSPDQNGFARVFGTFTLPIVDNPAASKGREVDFWVGISDGYNLDTERTNEAQAAIVQAGVRVSVSEDGSQVKYLPWMEWFPQYPVWIEDETALDLEAGDEVKIDIKIENPTEALLTIENVTKGAATRTTHPLTAMSRDRDAPKDLPQHPAVPIQPYYAVWMAENHARVDPKEYTSRAIPFLDFGEVRFSSCGAVAKSGAKSDLSLGQTVTMDQESPLPAKAVVTDKSNSGFSLRVTAA
ncbi:hypothetical protein GYMLUDRAFT_254698 [Collybiopsis luxurians FD-317 M1]|nr:hypothetical protein GYMLUDRAFT_254698 [Collybiopsis luxurians FD-317 M1]